VWLERRLELPLAVLGFVWLAILVLELVRGIGPVLEAASLAIWVIFIADFLLRLLLAPQRGRYLRKNWFTALSLVIPALRIARFARAIRAVRGIRLVRLVSSINRGMGALGRSMGRRGAGYVLALTFVVILAGAAGMLAFEGRADGGGLRNYGDALWFTAMIITTMGSQYWPASLEGRILAFLLSLYALGILGYVTAVLASFFVERDTDTGHSQTTVEVNALRSEIALLRTELAGRAGGDQAAGPVTGSGA
jgi:voltage-gated potassium channel